MKIITTKLAKLTPILAAALLLMNATPSQAQRQRPNADQIIRQAEENQRAIQKITEDFTRNALEIYDGYQKRKEEERAERQRERDADAADRRSNSDRGNNQSNSDNQ